VIIGAVIIACGDGTLEVVVVLVVVFVAILVCSERTAVLFIAIISVVIVGSKSMALVLVQYVATIVEVLGPILMYTGIKSKISATTMNPKRPTIPIHTRFDKAMIVVCRVLCEERNLE
jgi:hypothetical protein